MKKVLIISVLLIVVVIGGILLKSQHHKVKVSPSTILAHDLKAALLQSSIQTELNGLHAIGIKKIQVSSQGGDISDYCTITLNEAEDPINDLFSNEHVDLSSIRNDDCFAQYTIAYQPRAPHWQIITFSSSVDDKTVSYSQKDIKSSK